MTTTAPTIQGNNAMASSSARPGGRCHLNASSSTVQVTFCLSGGPTLGPCSPTLASGRDSFGCDPAVRSGPRTPRCPHATGSPTPRPRSARRVPAAYGAMVGPPKGRVHPPTQEEELGRLFGRGVQIPRCRGWQISPEPAGPGRASRGGETAAQHHANAEGPQHGSRPPVAGGGVCGRGARGRARPHPATAAPARRKPSRRDQ